jgi:hypothetical protein
MLDSLTSFATVLLALSVASERLVELIKGASQRLTGKKEDAATERWRQLGIHWISVLASWIVVMLTQEYIVTTLSLKTWGPGEIAAFTILASGGSSMWNSILSYLLTLKGVPSTPGNNANETARVDLRRALPDSMPTL